MPDEPQQPYEFGPDISWRHAALWLVLFSSCLTVAGLVINHLLQIAASLT